MEDARRAEEPAADDAMDEDAPADEPMETEAPATSHAERAREAEKEDAAKRAAALKEDKAKADEPQIEDDGGAAAAAATADHRAAEAAWDAKERESDDPRAREAWAYRAKAKPMVDAVSVNETPADSSEADKKQAELVRARGPSRTRPSTARRPARRSCARRRTSPTRTSSAAAVLPPVLSARLTAGLHCVRALRHHDLQHMGLPRPWGCFASTASTRRRRRRAARGPWPPCALIDQPRHVVADPAVAFLDGRHDGAVVELLDDVVQAEGVVRLGVDVEKTSAARRRGTSSRRLVRRRASVDPHRRPW